MYVFNSPLSGLAKTVKLSKKNSTAVADQAVPIPKAINLLLLSAPGFNGCGSKYSYYGRNSVEVRALATTLK